jgi:hypothetical protein
MANRISFRYFGDELILHFRPKSAAKLLPVALFVAVLAFSDSLGGSQVSSGFHVAMTLPQRVQSTSPLNAGSLCSLAPINGHPSGMYAAQNGGAYVENWETGDVYYCQNGVRHLIIHSVKNATGYYGMTGEMQGNSLVLIMSSFNAEGFFICKGVTPSGAESCSNFIPLSESYCRSTFAGGCIPDGIATDRDLDFYFVDDLNANLAVCYSSSHYRDCKTLEHFGSTYPAGLAIYQRDFYVTDSGCSGYVFKNGKVIAHLHQDLDSVVVSADDPSHTPHVFVGYGGECNGSPGGVYDLTDRTFLPTGLKSSDDIIGLTSTLEYDAFYNGGVYATTES